MHTPTPETPDNNEGDDESEGGSDSASEDGGGENGATADSMDAFCSVCHEPFDSPVKTQCGHAFCQVCSC